MKKVCGNVLHIPSRESQSYFDTQLSYNDQKYLSHNCYHCFSFIFLFYPQVVPIAIILAVKKCSVKEAKEAQAKVPVLRTALLNLLQQQ